MKHLMWAVIICLIPMLGTSQDTDYQLFELFYFTPESGHGADLTEAMSAHNKKYHPRGDYSAQVYSVMNGPNAGKYVWSMGPTTWTKIESRPADKGHDQDWDENVGIHIESYDATDFFKLNAEMSYFPGPTDLKVLNVWLVDLKDDQSYRYKQMMKKVTAVYKENEYEMPFGIYDRQLAGSHGIDVAMIWFVDGLEFFDTQGPFAKDFDEMYGEGSMENLMDEWTSIVDRMDVEVWRFDADMSGHDGTAVTRTGQD